MIVNHKCLECGFMGEVMEKNNKITCPNCGAINDVWLKDELPPINHR